MEVASATARQRKQYYSVTDAVWGNRKIGGSAKLVALRLAKNWPRIFPSIALLCDETGLSERTVQGSIKQLVALEIISVARRPGTSSVYEFPRVSIPELGRDDDAGGGGGGQNLPTPPPPQNLPTTSAESAHPPPQNLLPNSRTLTLEPKGRGGARAREQRGKPRPTPPPQVFHLTLHGWELSDELRSFALGLGLSARALERRIKRLRLVRIGGRSGVTDRDAYVRTCIEEWGEWESQRALNAPSGAGFGLSSSPRAGVHPWEPNEKMRRFAAEHGIAIGPLAEHYIRSGQAAARGGGLDADDAFVKLLCKAKRAKQASAA